MPQIIVTAHPTGDLDRNQIVHRERVNLSDFASEHFAAQLVERLGWAVEDAHELERALAERGLTVGAGTPYGASVGDDGRLEVSYGEAECETPDDEFDVSSYELARDPRSARVVTTAS